MLLPLWDRRPRLALACVLAFVGLCTLHKLDNGLVWDDVAIFEAVAKLVRGGRLTSVFSHSTLQLLFGESMAQHEAPTLELFRPLAVLSFVPGYLLVGPAPGVHHLTNTCLHLVCVVLVYALGRKLTQRPTVALVAAAWFGLTPVLTEAHVWISGRFDLMSTCFGLLGIWCWRAGRDSGRMAASVAWQFAAMSAFLVGLLAKEPLLFTLPACVAWPEREPLRLRARLVAALPLFISAGVYLGWRALIISAPPLPIMLSDLTLAVAHLPLLLLDAALHLCVPLHIYVRALDEDYAALGAAWLAGAAVLVMVVCAALARVGRARPLWRFGALWFGCGLVPVALVSTRLWPGFGRYLYLPAALALPSAVAACAHAFERVRPQLRLSRLPALSCLAYLALLGLRSHLAVYAYKSNETLFRATIAQAPERAVGYGYWGLAEAARGSHGRALPLFAQAFERAPYERRWASNYASELLFAGDALGALRIAEQSIQRFELAPDFHLLAAYALLASNERAAAVHVLECLLQDPRNSQGLEALTFLRTRHPDARRFREQFDSLLREPRYASLLGGA